MKRTSYPPEIEKCIQLMNQAGTVNIDSAAEHNEPDPMPIEDEASPPKVVWDPDEPMPVEDDEADLPEVVSEADDALPVEDGDLPDWVLFEPSDPTPTFAGHGPAHIGEWPLNVATDPSPETESDENSEPES